MPDAVRLFRLLILVLTTATGCSNCWAATLDQLSCPRSKWDTAKVNSFITQGTGNDGKQILRCVHRGLHDARNGYPVIPENSADAINNAFDVAPCVEVDLSVAAYGHVVLFHDRMTWRNVSTYITTNNVQHYNAGLAYTNSQTYGHDVYSTVTNAPNANDVLSDVSVAWLRSNQADVALNSEDYLWVGLLDLFTYVQRCPGVGVFELDIRDAATWNAAKETINNASRQSPGFYQHFLLKPKVWKIVGSGDYNALQSDFNNFLAIGLNSITTIMQAGTDTPEGDDEGEAAAPGRDYSSTVGNTSASNLILWIIQHHGGLEVSIPKGTSDALWQNTPITLPDPCHYPGASTAGEFAGWAAYNSRWHTCPPNSTGRTTIQGWIPIPDIDNGAFNPVNENNLPFPGAYGTDPYWQQHPYTDKNGISYIIYQGFMDYATGECCFVPAAAALKEQTIDYLPNSEGATVVVSDEDPSKFLTAGTFTTSQSFFLQPNL